MTPSEKQYLGSLVAATEATLDLFSNRNKTVREKMVARAFLRCLGVEFSEDELVVGPEEPVDISFKSARFQIMEMPGDRKRGLEMHEKLERYQKAKSINDVTDPWLDRVPLSFTEVSRKIAGSLSGKASKYGVQACAKIDALVYVNIPGRHLFPLTPKLDPIAAEELHRHGWRSVSMVFIPYSCVLVARADCPEFLRNKTGRVRMKWPHPGGWFDPQ
ncbi:DUF1780 domain-containing protein [Rhizobium leguminosarum]|uniref:DUF1780 domain-containing protein n=1 Tax=Rhizobium leguminosarum TaxID=384 RepID=UPI0014422DCF|nr:DUF1780 domain-containing protein [Rhizobium leguminosarum]NKL94188.1 hypothetical protein [Rhizobium leguminosarum bv. viciae]